MITKYYIIFVNKLCDTDMIRCPSCSNHYQTFKPAATVNNMSRDLYVLPPCDGQLCSLTVTFTNVIVTFRKYV